MPTDHDSTVALTGPTCYFTFAFGRSMFHIAFRVVIPVSENLVQVVNSPSSNELTFATKALNAGQS